MEWDISNIKRAPEKKNKTKLRSFLVDILIRYDGYIEIS